MQSADALSCPPRAFSSPSRAGTLGPQAVELAAEAGLELDDWQAWLLQEALGVRADGRWSAFEVGLSLARQNGKGGFVEARALAGLFLLDERLLTYTAHEFKTAQEHFLRIRDCLDLLPPKYRRRIKQVREAHGSESVEMQGGARLRFLARSSGSGRGFSGDVVFLDEAMILWLAAMGALIPTMSARANVTVGGPQLIYLGSAGLGDERSAVFAGVRDRGLAGAERLFWAEWGAGAADDHTGSAVDLNDVREWYRANPAMHGTRPRIEEEFVDGERAALDDEAFARERLGIWSNLATGAVIDPDLWAALTDATSKPAGPIALAVDVPPEGKAASIARACVGSDDRVYGEVDCRPGTSWAVERLAELSRRRNAVVALDGGARANSLVPALVEAGLEVGKSLIVYGTREVTSACGGFMDKLDEDSLRHAGQPELNSAVNAARRRKVGDAWAWHRRDASTDISPLVSLTLAVHALKEEPPRRKTGRSMAV